MKHILNDLTETEKNSIREQHTGGMKVMTENFSKLLNSKLGDVKPLVTEQQQTPPFTKGQKLSAMRSVDKKNYTIEIVDVQPGYLTAKIIGDGTYEGQPLDGKNPKELTYQNGKLMGNMQMGEFTIIPDNSSKLGESKLGYAKPILSEMMTKDSITKGASSLKGCFDPKKYPNLAKATRGSLKTVWGLILMQAGIAGELLSFGLSTPLSVLSVAGGMASTTVGLKKLLDANKGLIDDELKALTKCVFG